MNSPQTPNIAPLLDDFDRANRGFVAPTVNLLARFAREPDLHARFLNTLSMMEHIGSHKIMATQAGRAIDQSTLKHLAEEARHAFFFKRQAETLARRPLSFVAGELLMPSAARMYFQRLEGMMVTAYSRSSPSPKVIYLYMSVIVEFRAVWAYRLYQSVLQEAGSAISLRSLLAEESRHLDDMAARLIEVGAWDMRRVADFCAVETALYERLLSALEKSVVQPLAA